MARARFAVLNLDGGDDLYASFVTNPPAHFDLWGRCRPGGGPARNN